nr:hypothetical protein [Tanacetum cinerariifolium]
EPASLIGDDSQGEACPIGSGLEAKQDRANITKTSTLPSDSTPFACLFGLVFGVWILKNRISTDNIHTIMQCLSPKSTSFNEFSSNIVTALVCQATNRVYNFSKMIFNGMVRNVNNKVSKFLMYPRFLSKCLKMGQFGKITHTQTYVVPFHTKKIFTTLRVNSPGFSGRIVPLFNSMLIPQGEGSGKPTEPHHTPSPEAQQTSPTTTSSPSLPPVSTALIPTVTLTDTPLLRHYTRRAKIAQSLALPPIADEPTSLIGDVSQEPFGEDTLIKGRRLDEGKEAAKRVSDDTEEMATVLTSMDASSIPTSGGVHVVPTTAEVATATVKSTPYTKRKEKEKMVESDTPRKKKLQEQIDVKVARELEKEMAR